MNNNNITLQTRQSNTQNKNLNLIINSTYPQMNWRYYSPLGKLMRAISWIKKLQWNWIKWKRGKQTRENINIITRVEFEYTLCILWKNYWIAASRDLFRKIWSNCLNQYNSTWGICLISVYRYTSKIKSFSSTSVDYFGLIKAKISRKTSSNQETLKTYGFIFTCLNKKAIHIELSGHLPTDSWIILLISCTKRACQKYPIR